MDALCKETCSTENKCWQRKDPITESDGTCQTGYFVKPHLRSFKHEHFTISSSAFRC